jgi:glycosyltransferase involved in cell wall biosynthesis
MSAAVRCTVVLPVQNEIDGIAAAITNARRLGERVTVIDGGSTDGTIQWLATHAAHDLTVLRRSYDTSARQKNWALRHVTTPWVFFMDADEIPSEALVAAVREVTHRKAAAPDAVYAVRRRNYFLGQWMRHGGWWPDLNVRLLPATRGVYEDRPVHEHVQSDFPVSTLAGWLDHHTSPTIDRHVVKMLTWTRLEAQDMAARRVRVRSGPFAFKLMLRDAAGYLPGRPFWRFLYMYVLRRGFQDGRRGLHLAILSGFSDYVVFLRRSEAREVRSEPDT